MGGVAAVGRSSQLHHSHIERPRAYRATTLGEIYETSPPQISASGRRRCRAAGRVADREGANLSGAAGALAGRLFRRWPLDTGARLIAQWLSERLGHSFIVENRPGASGNLATQEVVRARPDGYT